MRSLTPRVMFRWMRVAAFIFRKTTPISSVALFPVSLLFGWSLSPPMRWAAFPHMVVWKHQVLCNDVPFPQHLFGGLPGVSLVCNKVEKFLHFHYAIFDTRSDVPLDESHSLHFPQNHPHFCSSSFPCTFAVRMKFIPSVEMSCVSAWLASWSISFPDMRVSSSMKLTIFPRAVFRPQIR